MPPALPAPAPRAAALHRAWVCDAWRTPLAAGVRIRFEWRDALAALRDQAGWQGDGLLGGAPRYVPAHREPYPRSLATLDTEMRFGRGLRTAAFAGVEPPGVANAQRIIWDLVHASVPLDEVPSNVGGDDAERRRQARELGRDRVAQNIREYFDREIESLPLAPAETYAARRESRETRRDTIITRLTTYAVDADAGDGDGARPSPDIFSGRVADLPGMTPLMAARFEADRDFRIDTFIAALREDEDGGAQNVEETLYQVAQLELGKSEAQRAKARAIAVSLTALFAAWANAESRDTLRRLLDKRAPDVAAARRPAPTPYPFSLRALPGLDALDATGVARRQRLAAAGWGRTVELVDAYVSDASAAVDVLRELAPDDAASAAVWRSHVDAVLVPLLARWADAGAPESDVVGTMSGWLIDLPGHERANDALRRVAVGPRRYAETLDDLFAFDEDELASLVGDTGDVDEAFTQEIIAAVRAWRAELGARPLPPRPASLGAARPNNLLAFAVRTRALPADKRGGGEERFLPLDYTDVYVTATPVLSGGGSGVIHVDLVYLPLLAHEDETRRALAATRIATLVYAHHRWKLDTHTSLVTSSETQLRVLRTVARVNPGAPGAPTHRNVSFEDVAYGALVGRLLAREAAALAAPSEAAALDDFVQQLWDGFRVSYAEALLALVLWLEWRDRARHVLTGDGAGRGVYPLLFALRWARALLGYVSTRVDGLVLPLGATSRGALAWEEASLVQAFAAPYARASEHECENVLAYLALPRTACTLRRVLVAAEYRDAAPGGSGSVALAGGPSGLPTVPGAAMQAVAWQQMRVDGEALARGTFGAVWRVQLPAPSSAAATTAMQSYALKELEAAPDYGLGSDAVREVWVSLVARHANVVPVLAFRVSRASAGAQPASAAPYRLQLLMPLYTTDLAGALLYDPIFNAARRWPVAYDAAVAEAQPRAPMWPPPRLARFAPGAARFEWRWPAGTADVYAASLPAGALTGGPSGLPAARLCAIADCAAQLLRGLAAVHARRIVSRDVKPANVVLAVGGGASRRVALTDWSICDVLEPPVARRTTFFATPSYEPPEMLLEAGRPTTAADVWAAGAVLYEMLTLRRLLPYVDGEDPALGRKRKLELLARALGAPSDAAWPAVTTNRFYERVFARVERAGATPAAWLPPHDPAATAEARRRLGAYARRDAPSTLADGSAWRAAEASGASGAPDAATAAATLAALVDLAARMLAWNPRARPTATAAADAAAAAALGCAPRAPRAPRGPRTQPP